MIKNDFIINIKHILALTPKKYKFFFLLIGISYSLIFIFEFYIPIYQKKIIDVAIDTKNIFNEHFYLIIALYFMFYFFDIAINYIYSIFFLRLEKEIVPRLFGDILALKRSTILKKGTGYYIDTLLNDSEFILNIFSLSLFTFIYSIIQSFLIFFLIWNWNYIVALIFLAAFVLNILISIFSSVIDRYLFSKMRNLMAYFSGFLVDVFSNADAIHNSLSFFRFKRKYLYFFHKNLKITKKSMIINNLVSSITQIITTLSFIIVLIFTLHLVIKGSMSYGMMIAVFSYFHMLFKPIDSFYNVISTYMSSEVAINRVLNITKNSNERLPTKEKKIEFLNEINQIRFENVDFKYEKNSTYILQNISFMINDKKKLGIIGLSGEGKTTLMKLLSLKEIMSSGEIFINKQSVFSLLLFDYYHHIAILSQEVEIFNKDLIFNLTLGKEIINQDKKNELFLEKKQIIKTILEKINNAIIKNKHRNKKHLTKNIANLFKKNKEDVLKFYYQNIKIIIEQNKDYSFLILDQENLDKIAIKMTHIELDINFVILEDLQNVISDLNMDNLKNRNFGEGGSLISGGQKQKIILGRFLLQKNHDLFILDEPFTNLDNLNKKKFIDILQKRLADKMGIVISHDFTILDKLVTDFIVISDNKIIQSGNHEELIKTKGLYKELYTNK